MLLPHLRWPLAQNRIRRSSVSNTFGNVRNNGTRPHQGWDLYAIPGTRCFAIADGVIRYCKTRGDYGLLILLEFEHRGDTLYAAYAHLGGLAGITEEDHVSAGDWIGITGNSGNATSMLGEDQHLHFEIRTERHPGKGLEKRWNPHDLYKATPLHHSVFDGRNSGKPRSESEGLNPDSGAFGLRVPGVNA